MVRGRQNSLRQTARGITSGAQLKGYLRFLRGARKACGIISMSEATRA